MQKLGRLLVVLVSLFNFVPQSGYAVGWPSFLLSQEQKELRDKRTLLKREYQDAKAIEMLALKLKYHSVLLAIKGKMGADELTLRYDAYYLASQELKKREKALLAAYPDEGEEGPEKGVTALRLNKLAVRATVNYHRILLALRSQNFDQLDRTDEVSSEPLSLTHAGNYYFNHKKEMADVERVLREKSRLLLQTYGSRALEEVTKTREDLIRREVALSRILQEFPDQISDAKAFDARQGEIRAELFQTDLVSSIGLFDVASFSSEMSSRRECRAEDFLKKLASS